FGSGNISKPCCSLDWCNFGINMILAVQSDSFRKIPLDRLSQHRANTMSIDSLVVRQCVFVHEFIGFTLTEFTKICSWSSRRECLWLKTRLLRLLKTRIKTCSERQSCYQFSRNKLIQCYPILTEINRHLFRHC